MESSIETKKASAHAANIFLYFKTVSKNWASRHSANKEVKAALLYLQGQVLFCRMINSVSFILSCNRRKYSSASRTFNVQGSATCYSICNSSYQLLTVPIKHYRSSLEEIIYFASLFQENANLRHFSCLIFFLLSR